MPVGRAKEMADSLAWCPDEHRRDYFYFQAKGFTAAEARAFIEDHMAVMERRSRRATAIAA